MRTLRLAHIAAEAEALAWRRRARRVAIRAVWAALALAFLLAGLVFLETAFWLFLAARRAGLPAARGAGGGNGLRGLARLLPALLRSADDPGAREAVHLRRAAVAGIEERLRLGSALLDMLQTVALVLHRRRAPPP